MAGVSDKARFYLERSVPELRDYERKGIFSRDEIAAITSKRSEFEHTLNARGPRPSDYTRYVAYEMNLNNLRKKRCRRLGVKAKGYDGQRTIFSILDRATKKHPGDISLWMQYITFCQREKANKKLARVFTRVLRLKPREGGLWILAAKHYAEDLGDMNTARGYMQRGLRFCKDQSKLWIEYFKLEISYLAKLAARRKILGLDEDRSQSAIEMAQEDDEEDMLKLPSVTPNELNVDTKKGLEDMDVAALERIASAPAFTGDIPIAIFDAASKQFSNDSPLAEKFFDTTIEFDPFPAATRISQHIVIHLKQKAPLSAEAIVCAARSHIWGVEAQSNGFPIALGVLLAALKQSQNELSLRERTKVAQKALLMLLPYLRSRDLDEDVVTVINARIKSYTKVLSSSPENLNSTSNDAAAKFIEKLKNDGRDQDARTFAIIGNAMESG